MNKTVSAAALAGVASILYMLGTHNAKKEIARRRMHHHQKRERGRDFFVKAAGKQSNPQYLNDHAVKMANDANEAAAEAESIAVRYVYLSLGVVLSGDDAGEVEYRAEYVRTLFSEHDFDARIEDFNTIEAWRGFLPTSGRAAE